MKNSGSADVEHGEGAIAVTAQEHDDVVCPSHALLLLQVQDCWVEIDDVDRRLATLRRKRLEENSAKPGPVLIDQHITQHVDIARGFTVDDPTNRRRVTDGCLEGRARR